MDTQQRKEFFEKEIALPLSDLMNKCKAAGISFLAAAEWGHNAGDITFSRTPEASDQFDVAIKAIHCLRDYGGVDTFMTELMIHLERKPGISSYEIRRKDGNKG